MPFLAEIAEFPFLHRPPGAHADDSGRNAYRLADFFLPAGLAGFAFVAVFRFADFTFPAAFAAFFLPPPKIVSQLSAYFLVAPRRVMVMVDSC
jgi:hypothetical protein